MNSLSKRIVSLLLVFVMILGFIPSVFGVANLHTTPTRVGPLTPADLETPFLFSGKPSGYRISIYFARQIGEEVGPDGLTHAIYGWGGSYGADYWKCGESVDIRNANCNHDPWFYGEEDVFAYINDNVEFNPIETGGYSYSVFANGTFGTNELKAKYDYIQNCFKEKSNEYNQMGYPELKTFLSLMRGNLTSNNSAIPDYIQVNDYPYYSTTSDEFKGYLMHPLIMEQISWLTSGINNESQNSPYFQWQAYNFIMGEYKKGDEVILGQYKMYIEPIFYGWYRGGYGLMTYREMLAAKEAGYKLSPFSDSTGRTRIRATARALHLETVDPSLKFSGTNINAGSLVGHASLPEGKDEYLNHLDPNTAAYNYGGVAVITSPEIPRVTGPKVKIVDSYVEIQGYERDENGSLIPIFKTAEPSTVTTMVIPKDGTVSIEPVVKVKGNTNYLLNDVIVTTQDLLPRQTYGTARTVTWEEATPEKYNEKVEFSSEYISSYSFGDFTFSTFLNAAIENYIKETGNEDLRYYYSSTEHRLYLLNIIKSAANNSLERALLTTNFDKLKNDERAVNAWVSNLLQDSITQCITYDALLQGLMTIETSPAGYDVQPIVDISAVPVAEELLPRKEDSSSQGGRVDASFSNDSEIEEDVTVDNRNAFNSLFEESFSVENKKLGPLTPIVIVAGMAGYVNHVNGLNVTVVSDEGVERVIYRRYLVVGSPKQIDIIITEDYRVDPNNPDITKDIQVQDLIIDDEYTELFDLRDDEKYKDYEYISYYTDTEFITDPNKLPKDPVPPEAKTDVGPDLDPVHNLLTTENVYVIWKLIYKNEPDPIELEVPEWRLSRFWNNLTDLCTTPYWQARMSLNNVRTDSCCCGHMASLSPSGNYSHSFVNPNNTIAVGANNTPDLMKVKTWAHSATLSEGDSDTVSLYKPNARIELEGNFNAIKSTDTSKLQAAKWLNTDAELNEMNQYDITNSAKTNGPLGPDYYDKSDTFKYGIKNNSVYTNIWYVCNCDHSEDGHGHSCTRGSQTFSNSLDASNVSYFRWPQIVTVRFYRYNAEKNGILNVEQDVINMNGLTTLRYQLNESINVYPEIGMLFEDDKELESLRWTIADEARQIKPVVWQTLEHKVWVKPTSSGTSVATDSRGIAQARAIGEANKQIIYKGAGVNTNFRLYRDKESSNLSLLTVKTYALDFKTGDFYNEFNNPTGGTSAWGNSYNSYDEHNTLINNIKTNNKAQATEKLLVDTPNFGSIEYQGLEKKQQTNGYNIIKYSDSASVKVAEGSNGEAVVFEHELIIRGGYLIGVKYNDKSGGALKPIAITELESKDEDLYKAILEMHLYNVENDKNKTVLLGFEHEDGKALDEAVYADKLKEARKKADIIDLPDYASIDVGDNWYSEDTTVLVVREYVSNFEVPSISISDKLSMTVGPTPGGLTTPTNKNDFFSVLGKGYLSLRYDLPINKPYETVLEDINLYFYYTSFPNDISDTKEYLEGDTTSHNTEIEPIKFGEQDTNYLVPNVSITDTTRLN